MSNSITERILKWLRDLTRAFYIDDWSCRAASREEAVEMFKEAKSFLPAGSFNLRKRARNHKEVAGKIAAYNKQIVGKSGDAVDQIGNTLFAKMSMGGLSEIESGKELKIPFKMGFEGR